MSTKPYFVYIVECNDGTYYTGITVDLRKRIEAHNCGKGAKYTRTRGPVRLHWARVFPSRTAAAREERRIKKLSPAKKKECMI